MKIHKRVNYRFKKIVEIAEVKENEKILDLGCGINQNLKNFLPKVKYIGVDIKSGDIKHDLEKSLPKILKKQNFDVIFLNEILEHIENFKSLLSECREILTIKGRVIISTPSNNRILYGDFFNGIGEHLFHIHCFRKTNMRNLARICGFNVDRIIGTTIRIPPILPKYIVIPTNQTIYTEVIIYRLSPKSL